MPGNTETFLIKIDSNAAKTARDDANELANLQKRFEQSTTAIKQMEVAYRRLKQGGMVNLQTAKDLKSKLDEQKAALAAMTAKAHEAGTSLESLTAASKDNAAKSAEASKQMLAMADAAGGALAGALIAVEGAAIGAGIAFAKFVLESTNLARSQQLARMAVTGTAEDAKRLGSQVDALALKVPTAKDELNKLAIELRRSGLSGQTLIDTLNATAQASAALGGDAAKKIQDFVDRSKQLGNFSLNPQELIGTGVAFADVAESLAKNLGVGIAQAQQALIEGRVRLGDGAAALRGAIEKKFGALNLAKMLDLDVMKTKFTELLQSLTKDLNLEPLLNALKDFFTIFDQSTVAGASIKKLTTVLGEGLIDTAAKGIPIVKAAFEGLILVALDLYIAILKLKIWFKDTFGDTQLLANIDTVKTAIEGAKIAVVALAVAFGILAITTLLALSPAIILFAGIALAVGIVVAQFTLLKTAFDAVFNIDWAGIGKSILDGLLAPLKTIEAKGASIAKMFVKGFTGTDGIDAHSPSKVFADAGLDVTDGFNQGISSGAPGANRQLADMATPPSGGASSSGGGAPNVNVTITINVDGSQHKDDQSLVAEMRGQFRNEITRLFERDASALGMKRAG